MHGVCLGPGELIIIAWKIYSRSIREEKSLVKTNARYLNPMLFSAGVFMHSKPIFSKLSKFLNTTFLYTCLDSTLCI